MLCHADFIGQVCPTLWIPPLDPVGYAAKFPINRLTEHGGFGQIPLFRVVLIRLKRLLPAC